MRYNSTDQPQDESLIATKVVEKYKTGDPFIIAENMGCKLMYHDIIEVLSMVVCFDDQIYIVLNKNISQIGMMKACAYELGYILLESPKNGHITTIEAFMNRERCRIKQRLHKFVNDLLAVDTSVQQRVTL